MYEMTRYLAGDRPGIQVNATQDLSSNSIYSPYDEKMAIIMRTTRGPIDKPFAINKNNYLIKLGRGEQIRVNPLNEAYVHAVEAVKNGASEVIIQRLITDKAIIRYGIITLSSGAILNITGTGSSIDIDIENGGIGYKNGEKIVFEDSAGTGAAATIEVSDGALLEMAIPVAGTGTGYAVDDEIHLTGRNGGINAIAKVATIGVGGIILTADITGNGSKYKFDEVIDFTPVIGSGLRIKIDTITAGVITSAKVSSGGAGYQIGQKVRLINAANVLGGGAVFTITSINLNGSVVSFAITSGGTLYVSKIIYTTAGIVGSGGTAKVTDSASDGEITGIIWTNHGTGYSANATAYVPSSFKAYPSAVLPQSYLLAIKHLACHNEGITISLHADEKVNNAGDLIANDMISLIIKDANDNKLAEFYGSLIEGKQDELGNSLFLEDIITRDSGEFIGKVGGDITQIDPYSDAYGYADSGQLSWIKSNNLKCFLENGDAYIASDYDSAIDKLKRSIFDFGYLSTGGSVNLLFISKLTTLAYQMNRLLRIDIPGTKSVAQAIAFARQLNIGANDSEEPELMRLIWSPQQADCPAGINGNIVVGTSANLIAKSCKRNSIRNALGFANKHYPIAGKDWPLNRKNIRQIYDPTEQELEQLAAAKITPVLNQSYSDSNRTVFADSLTCKDTITGLTKLDSVADMISDIRAATVKFDNDIRHFPMDVSVKRMKDFLEFYLRGAKTTGWLVQSQDPDMNGKEYRYEVYTEPEHPNDNKIIKIFAHFTGVNRRSFLNFTVMR